MGDHAMKRTLRPGICVKITNTNEFGVVKELVPSCVIVVTLAREERYAYPEHLDLNPTLTDEQSLRLSWIKKDMCSK